MEWFGLIIGSKVFFSKEGSKLADAVGYTINHKSELAVYLSR